MIRAHNPMILPGVNGNQDTSIAVEFSNGDKLVSLALNNSGGRMKKLCRVDLRLFIGKEDITPVVFEEDKVQGIVHASMENFETAMRWLRQTEWGLEANNDM